MRVMTLGSLPRRGVGFVEPQDLPSSQSVIACLRGEKGAIGKTVLTTMLRTLLIVPGMWLTGARGTRLWLGASAASGTITAFLFFWYAAQERGRRDAGAAASLPAPTPGIYPPIIDTTAESTP